ncbi:Rv0340 family protein [Mycobacterium sp. CPCC 205372]|uniref:Rv0340 family protein n=1 Tax=Mycobacterium hippophais TaxID=3016340 RepID=A0ABT4PU70_9MYCO|nr:Rv0340 family IniB-related protein [Mycobacterium hippophais]MCZ8380104.1 Rv0340 family protein [Mycobacterium hippophais]
MANSLLDFVMSLVRDPDAAARYTADPAGALAEANLPDVTSVDVANLIPVVSESLSMTGPASGFDAVGAETAGNVWASGAATAAFDAFGDPGAGTAIDDGANVISDVVDEPVVQVADTSLADLDSALGDPAAQFDTAFADAPSDSAADFAADWGQSPSDDQVPGADGQSFDLFN